MVVRRNLFIDKKKVRRVGFEPTHPKILVLETSALDRSAIGAYQKCLKNYSYIDKNPI